MMGMARSHTRSQAFMCGYVRIVIGLGVSVGELYPSRQVLLQAELHCNQGEVKSIALDKSISRSGIAGVNHISSCNSSRYNAASLADANQYPHIHSTSPRPRQSSRQTLRPPGVESPADRPRPRTERQTTNYKDTPDARIAVQDEFRRGSAREFMLDRKLRI